MKKKILSLFIVIAITIFNFIPYVNVYAEPGVGQVSNINQVLMSNFNVVTLYVGNISVNGISTIKYLYSDGELGTTTLDEIRTFLTDDYSSLLPTTGGQQIAVSNDSSVTVNEAFTDAGMVAVNKYPTGTVTDTSETILYNQNAYNELVTATQTDVNNYTESETANRNAYNERKTAWESDPENAGIEFPEQYIPLYVDNNNWNNLLGNGFISVTSVSENSNCYKESPSGEVINNGGKYILRNGQLYSVNSITVGSVFVRVVNTSANVTMSNSLTPITSANITLKAPKIGDKVEKITKNDGYGDYDAQSLQPTVSTTTEGLSVNAFWVKGLESDSEEPFYGTFEDDIYYYAMIDFEAEEGYELPSTFPDGIKVNGKTPDEVFAVLGGKWNHCVVKIKASSLEETTPTYEYMDNTANQTFTINKDDNLTFRINADYSLFADGGKVYVDNNEVAENNYTSKSGSTIISLKKDYLNTLSAGTHTLKVAFNDGGIAETTFKISGASTNNPKTGDNIMLYISMLGLSVIVCVGLSIYTKKRFN